MMMQSAVDGATSAAPELATAAGNAVDAAASKANGQLPSVPPSAARWCRAW